MKKYLIRFMSYIVSMAVVLTVILFVLGAAGMLRYDGDEIVRVLFTSRSGMILLGALFFFAVLYPKISFTTIGVPVSLSGDRRLIDAAFDAYGYKPVRERNGAVVYRYGSWLKRLLARFNDAVTVTQADGRIEIEGLKKVVSRVELRLDAYRER